MLNVRILIITCSLLFSACTTWNHNEINQGSDGNYWVKEEIPSCETWRDSYKRSISLTNDLYAKSKELSYICLVNGPKDQGIKNENSAIEIYKSYLKVTSDIAFSSATYNRCFGSENFSFYNSTSMDALRAYVFSVFHCSTEMAEKFKKGKSSSEYEEEVQLFLKKYNEKFKSISGK